jgi:predicted dehydrogenase
MTAQIRLGIVGAGQAYRVLYQPALALRTEFSVVATADPAAEAEFQSAEGMLESSELDGVIVLSPARLHAEHVALAMAHGLRVLVEKPPAVSLAEIDAWARPELVTPAFSRRYWPSYQRQTDSKRFVFHMETNPDGWGAQSVESPVRDLLPHAADLAVWLSGSGISSVVEVSRTAARASGAFLLENDARFDWIVAHAGAHIETLACDGTLRPSVGLNRVGEALRRIRRKPTVAVAGVADLLADWAGTFHGDPSAVLPGIEAARSCARVIETVESVGATTRT